MSEANRRWRCPYCDGLNDWQNEVCEICGDGRRSEVEAAEKVASTTEIPKTDTPQEREAESIGSGRMAEREAPRTDFTPPSSLEPPRRKKKGGIWLVIVLVIVVVAAIGGRFLANRFVTSMEKDKTEEFAVPIATPEAPDEAPAATEKSPAEEQVQGAQATKVPVESTQAIAPVVIDTVTDNQDGTATIKLKINEARDEYNIYWYCEGADLNEPSIIQFNTHYTIQALGRVLPRDEVILRPPEDSITLPVVPGCYTRFIIGGLFNTGASKDEDYWVSEPYFFKENTDKPTTVITDMHFLKWDSGEDYSDAFAANLDGDVSVARRVSSEYTPTTAQNLNELLQKSVDHETSECIGYEIHTETEFDLQASTEWDAKYRVFGKKIPFMEYLSGPGVHLMQHNNSFGGGQETQFICFSVFHDEYLLMKRFGGFPPGDYTIDFFYCGVRMYTMHFTLN